MHRSILLAILAAVAAAKPSTSGFSRRQQQQDIVDPGTIEDCTYFSTYPDPASGNTCESIALYWGLTVKEFERYNPVLGSNCNLQQGHSYCVEENYGDGPESASTTTTSAMPTTTETSKPSPTQPGLVDKCTRYYFVNKGDTCVNIVNMYHTFTLKDFYSWNPSVNTDCTGLQANVYVCVGVPGTPTVAPTNAPGPSQTSSGPSPEQTGITKDCKRYYKVVSGDNCQGIVERFGTFTLDQFYSWNPSIGSNCQSLFLGYYVCVGVSTTPTQRPSTTSAMTSGPSPTQSGIIKTCNKFVKSDDHGAACHLFAPNQGISLAQLYAWNSVLGRHGEHCDQFRNSEYYCVGVSGPMPADGPSQPGVVDTCVEYAKTNPGGTCDSFAYYHDISKPQLYAMNPVLGKNGEYCQSKFWANEYYCTAVAGPDPYQPRQDGIISTCNKYVKSNSDGACRYFAPNQGISYAQLYAWNNALGHHGEHCDQFRGDTYYCVGVSGPLQPPGPSQPGVTDTCTRYAKSSAGGTCPGFAQSNGISDGQLYAWNSVLGRNGENCQTKFLADEYYCVEVAG